MKKILLFGAIALSSLSFGQNVPSYVPTNGLVGWYPFDGNGNDESGNGNNGTVNGATLTNDRNGNANSAYTFDGVNDYISVYNAPFINYPFSISSWVNFNPNSTSGHSPIIGLGELGSYSLNSFYFSPHYGLNGTPSIGTAGANDITSTSANTVTSNNWVYLTVTVSSYSVNSVNFYINGILLGSNQTGGSNVPFPLNNVGFTIGRHSGASGSDFFIGQIDDLTLYNRVLSQQEITTLYEGCSLSTSTITPQSNTTFCQGGSVALEASTGSGYTYEWYNNSSLINNAASSTYQATTSGNYTVKVIDGACDATSSATTVTVNQNPLVSFTLPSMLSNESSVYALNASPTGGTYNGSGISGASFDPSSSGLGTISITYDYIDNNNCSASKTASTVVYDTTGIVCTSYVSVSVTDTLIMDVSLAGVSAPNDVNRMKVYPNPSNDIVNIDNGNYALMNGYSVKIMNALGQEVFSSAINSQLLQVSVNQLGATGNYFINVFDNNQNLLESKVLVLQ